MFENSEKTKNYKTDYNYVNIYSYSIIGVYIKPNRKLALKRNKQCNYPINIYSLEAQYLAFEKPYKDEGFKKIITKRAK